MKGLKGKGKVSLSFKYRIYPAPEIEQKLMETMKTKAKVYNKRIKSNTYYYLTPKSALK